MKQAVNVSISAVIVALVALSIVISAALAQQQRHARLAVQATAAGLSVTGRDFLARERVVLRASFNGHSLRRVVTATAAGRFTTQLSDTDTSCSQVVVAATGARGSTAAVRRVQIPEACGIVIQP